jgi:gamma-glutamyltranspeptidase/glutathione hydrolase
LDAAIAANAAVGVVWPHMCGVGGDLFLLVYWARSGELVGLDASGRSPAGASVERARAMGHQEMPLRGGMSITVPGAVDGWITALERFGSRELGHLLGPAIRYAEQGFPISGWLAYAIADRLPVLHECPAALEVYAPGGRLPRPADRLANLDLAHTLRGIAERGRDAFYAGETAARIARAVRESGGVMDEDDLAAQRSDWVKPLCATYRGVQVAELPPSTQGVTALQMFGLVDGFDVASAGHNSVEAIHWGVEAKRVAFADRDRYLADPAAMTVAPQRLLDPAYLRQRRALIDDQRAAAPIPAGTPAADGDTIYLCAADRDDNVVSLIQSLFHAFGSGVVAARTGVVLHNRGGGFRLDPEHANALGPRKRPLHTLIPAMALRDGAPLLAFGARGANGQPQTQLQVLSNVLDFGMNPQEAVESPRWVHGGPARHHPPDAVVLESRMPDLQRLVAGLQGRGHEVFVSDELDLGMGTAQMIQVDRERGVLMAGSDPRGDGAALGW